MPLQAPSRHVLRPKDLGAFLRTRREHLDPGRLGLPQLGRRRTPGLRREEVAQLADVSTTWYTWLEQGRDVKPSVRALSAIAEALQCSVAERRHLFELAGQPEPVTPKPACQHITATHQLLLDQLDPLPALVQNARFDIIGFNQALCALVQMDLSTVPDEDRNCIYLSLSDTRWRSSLADWEAVLPRMVGLFRASMTPYMDDPHWQALLDKFRTASPDFAHLWEKYEVECAANQLKTFRHPAIGDFALQQVNWWSAPRDGDRLVVYLPVDAAGEQAIATLAAAR